ncbi:MAG: hypothetical protein WDN25_26430 [Acetobacteraceae bacterium]
MRRCGWLAALVAMLAAPAHAAGIVTTVTDEAGRPLADAVVSVMPDGATPMPASASPSLAAAMIDQQGEMFVPDVVVIHTGGAVTFRNSDRTRHHVYSFSSIRPFEFVQNPNDVSSPVRFDTAGFAAIGCNIHDNMIAYVYVTTAPWAVVTDAAGHARFADLPAGNFIATVWHPRLRPSAKPPAKAITLATQDTTLAVTIPVLPPRRLRSREY